jgi:sterol desaturase/sphingolipid hydroxylase (fatty acid hydroxylase superfamily)
MDYIALSIPVFFLLIALELIYDVSTKKQLFRLNDSLANISCGIGQQVTGIFFKTGIFFSYQYLHTHYAFFQIPNNLFTWILLFIGVDFCYYWFHRLSHEINFILAAHVVHHQSEDYNLTVALRQSWFQGLFSWVFYIPLAIIGFSPVAMLMLMSFNTLYQFWIHTQTIKNIGWFEYIFNTLSHHRVHHGSNNKYIDKNHAGTLIIWDKLFGTFQKEEEEVVYGITTPLQSFNPIWANFQYWQMLIKAARSAKHFTNKIWVFFKPPGWQPKNEHLLGLDSVSLPKYNPIIPNVLAVYAFSQYICVVSLAAVFLFTYMRLSGFELILLSAFILFSIYTLGILFDTNTNKYLFELFRLCLNFIVLYAMQAHISTLIFMVLASVNVMSIAYFFIVRYKSIYYKTA